MLGQSASLRRMSGAYTADGTPVLGSPRTIAVAWQEGTQRVVTSGAESQVATVSSRVMYTDTEVGFGDEVTFGGKVYHVAGVSTTPTLDGSILMWEAAME